MASPRFRRNTNLSFSIHERQQIQTRIRALQQRINALHEELSRSSSGTKTAMMEIEQTYTTITSEFREQRDQLLRRLQHVRKDIKQSAQELEKVRRNLTTAQSFRLPKNSPRYSPELEAQELHAMVDDIERVLHQIAQQLKQYRFVPSRGTPLVRTLGTIRIKDFNPPKENEFPPISSSSNRIESIKDVAIQKLYVIDLDIVAHWVIASIEKRIFLCNNEGDVRIFSYSRRLHRQPLLSERFHLSTRRLITAFAITEDYLIAFESDTQMLTLHTHHGALLIHFTFPYEPSMIVRSDFRGKALIWTCSRTQQQCYEMNVNHLNRDIRIVDQIDFTSPINNALVDTMGISCDLENRVAVHGRTPTKSDRLLLFTNQQNRIISLDHVKHNDRLSTSHIERVLLVPNHPHLIALLYAPQYPTHALHEIVLLNISLQPAQIVGRVVEPNAVFSLDLSMNGEFIYSSRTHSNTRIPSKMNIYRFLDD